jgi:integrase
MGRRGQIVRLRWRDVDLEIGAVEWGVTKTLANRGPRDGPSQAVRH